MKWLTLSAGLVTVVALAGCGDKPIHFGSGLEECTLRHVTRVSAADAREEARAICERRFTRSPTKAENRLFDADANVEFDQDDPKKHAVHLFVTNRSENVRILETYVEVTYYAAPVVDGKPLPPIVEPGAVAVISKPVDPNDTQWAEYPLERDAPSPYAKASTVTVLRVAQLK